MLKQSLKVYLPLIDGFPFVHFISHYVNLTMGFGNHFQDQNFKDRGKRLSSWLSPMPGMRMLWMEVMEMVHIIIYMLG